MQISGPSQIEPADETLTKNNKRVLKKMMTWCLKCSHLQLKHDLDKYITELHYGDESIHTFSSFTYISRTEHQYISASAASFVYQVNEILMIHHLSMKGIIII